MKYLHDFFAVKTIPRRTSYAIILLLWFATMLLQSGQSFSKQLFFSVAAGVFILTLVYFVLGFVFALYGLFTSKIVIYEYLFWFGIIIAILGLTYMSKTLDERQTEQFTLGVLVGLAWAWAARANYFGSIRLRKEKNSS